MEKMYCFYCDKEVTGNIRVEKTKYTIQGKGVYVDNYVFTCSYCKTEYDFEFLDKGLSKIYDSYEKSYSQIPKNRYCKTNN